MEPIVNMNIPKAEDVQVSDVVQYLNEVLERYGPPCDFCIHYTIVCIKMIRNRRYELAIGPYESWYIRKFCGEFIPRAGSDDSELRRSVRSILDCNVQMYG